MADETPPPPEPAAEVPADAPGGEAPVGGRPPSAYPASSGRPVFLLAFSNDRYGPTTGYLRDLVAEQRAIEKALAAAAVEVVARSNATRDDLFDALARHNDRIIGFHYGGHATESVLMLEDDVGRPAAARIEGLAGRLALLPRLSLVVLNGCSTSAQVEVLQERVDVPVIATDQAIVDAVARDFAQRFYADLAADRSIGEAYESAVSVIEAAVAGPEATHRSAAPAAPTERAGATRMLEPAEHTTDGGWPWRLYADPTNTAALGWRISHALAPRVRRWPRRLLLLGLLAGAVAFGWELLAPAPCSPRAEACNGVDDDCDRAIDEGGGQCGPMGLGRVWGEGRCVEAACVMSACPDGWHDVDGDYATGCEYACRVNGEETCNAADDDCDGIVDEGFEGCDPHCDAVDDDGDGRSDEGCAVVRCGAQDAAPVPPCNGCPAGVEVPAGWVCIPPGEVSTGSDAPAPHFTRRMAPPRRLRIERPFLMQATEVTQRQWTDLARADGVDPAPSYHGCPAPDGGCPVDRVSRAEVVWYANALSVTHGLVPCYDGGRLGSCRENMLVRRCPPLEHGCDDPCSGLGSAVTRAPRPGCTGARLPTVDEWTYAAQAGTGGRFGDAGDPAALRQVAWFSANAGGRPHPVGRLAPNRWGVYDLFGNVNEWAGEGVFVGCNYNDPTAMCAVAALPNENIHVGRSSAVGFRLVRSLPEPTPAAAP